MQIATMRQGNVLVITVGEPRLDARGAGSFRELVAEFIRAGHRRIVLNLAAVEFIDSSGLGALVAILKTIGPRGELVLCGIRESIARLFQLTRMDKVFVIRSGQEEALSKLAA